MKKIILFSLLLTSFFCSSQNSTTFDEYNYMVKGYKIQVSSGLDIKQGYFIKDLYLYDAGNYTFDYKAFIRQDKSLAGIILVATSKVWQNVYYLCIPVNQPEMLKIFNLSVSTWDESMTTAYASSSTYMLSTLFTGYYQEQLSQLNHKK